MAKLLKKFLPIVFCSTILSCSQSNISNLIVDEDEKSTASTPMSFGLLGSWHCLNDGSHLKVKRQPTVDGNTITFKSEVNLKSDVVCPRLYFEYLGFCDFLEADFDYSKYTAGYNGDITYKFVLNQDVLDVLHHVKEPQKSKFDTGGYTEATVFWCDFGLPKHSEIEKEYVTPDDGFDLFHIFLFDVSLF